MPSALFAYSKRRGSHVRYPTENVRRPPTSSTTLTVIGLATARDTASLKGLDVDVNPDPSTVTGGKNPGSIISYIRSNAEEQTEALLQFLIMTAQPLSVSSNFSPNSSSLFVVSMSVREHFLIFSTFSPIVPLPTALVEPS